MPPSNGVNQGKRIYEIDGRRFSTLDEFYDEIDRAQDLMPWGHNLDAFADILYGGFGTPEEGFTLRWLNHKISVERLGYAETIRQCEGFQANCHPTNRDLVAAELAAARAEQGPTAFDWIIQILRDHGPTGGVDLLLE